MSVTTYTSMFDFDDPNVFPGLVVVYVPTTGMVWQCVDTWDTTETGEFGIIDPDTGVMSGYTTGGFYGAVREAKYCAGLDAVFAVHSATPTTSKLSRYDSDGTLVWRVAYPFDLFAMDPAGAIYAVYGLSGGYSASKIYSIDAATGAIGSEVYTLPWGYFVADINAIVADGNGDFWFAASDYTTEQRIYKLDASSWTATQEWSGAAATQDMALVYLPGPNQIAAIRNDTETLVILDATDGSEVSSSALPFTNGSWVGSHYWPVWNPVRGALPLIDFSGATPKLHDVDTSASSVRSVDVASLVQIDNNMMAVNTDNGDVYTVGILDQPTEYWTQTRMLVVWRLDTGRWYVVSAGMTGTVPFSQG